VTYEYTGVILPHGMQKTDDDDDGSTGNGYFYLSKNFISSILDLSSDVISFVKCLIKITKNTSPSGEKEAGKKPDDVKEEGTQKETSLNDAEEETKELESCAKTEKHLKGNRKAAVVKNTEETTKRGVQLPKLLGKEAEKRSATPSTSMMSTKYETQMKTIHPKPNPTPGTSTKPQGKNISNLFAKWSAEELDRIAHEELMKRVREKEELLKKQQEQQLAASSKKLTFRHMIPDAELYTKEDLAAVRSRWVPRFDPKARANKK